MTGHVEWTGGPMKTYPHLDEQVAEHIMGWHRGKGGAIGCIGYEWPAYWYDADGRMQQPCATDPIANLRAWSPSSSLEDHMMLMVEIARRDLEVRFLQALAEIVEMRFREDAYQMWYVSIEHVWSLFDTSFDVHCAAVLRVLGVEL